MPRGAVSSGSETEHSMNHKLVGSDSENVDEKKVRIGKMCVESFVM